MKSHDGGGGGGSNGLNSNEQINPTDAIGRRWLKVKRRRTSSLPHSGTDGLTKTNTPNRSRNQTIFHGLADHSVAGTILVQARDPTKLCEDLQIAIDEHRFIDAWNLHEKHIQIEGFPRKSVFNKFLTCLAASSDNYWLEKAYGLVEKAFQEHKQNLLEKETLLSLSLALAKSGLPVYSSTLLRKLVETEQFPHVNSWSVILGYMSQTAPGSYLSAELVLEIGFLFQDGRVDPRKKTNQPLIDMKPNMTAFNIALAGCLLFDTTKKAEQLLDMMPWVDVKPDAALLIAMAHIYERNGRREELKKLKRHIDECHNLNDNQFRQFYNCLLNCHLKFGDLESASNMVLDMIQKSKKAHDSIAVLNLLSKPHENGKDNDLSEFGKDRNFLEHKARAKELLDVLLAKLQKTVELITTERGVLQPTEKIYVKLVKAFLEADKMKDLAEFLIKAESDNSVLVEVIESCIAVGRLDQAHDLLDEMRLAGVKITSSVYSSLLKSYCKENRNREVASLLRDVQKDGVQLDSSCYKTLIESKVLQNDTQGALHLFREMKDGKIPMTGNRELEKSDGEKGIFMKKLLDEIQVEKNGVDHGVHDWNNVIHFFCKKRLMQDAEKALKRMRSLGHCPNAQTFHSMVTGYASVGGKYTEVTELWGEMKEVFNSGSGMKFDQELLDSVLYTFVRGGFFLRANEVVEMMEREEMFVDKYKYRTLFLKYHKTMYKGKASKVQTPSQVKKREAGLKFKKWVGLF